MKETTFIITVSQFKHRVSLVNVPWNIWWIHVGSSFGEGLDDEGSLMLPPPFCMAVCFDFDCCFSAEEQSTIRYSNNNI